MRQARIDRFGGPEELYVVTDAEIPQPGPGQLLVKVRAAGTNPLDYKIRDGSSGMAKKLTEADFPLVLGRECCGTVAAVGEGVAGFAEGDLVFGMPDLSHPGRCYAEYVTVPASAMVHAPEGADPIMLGGTSLVALTAWIASHEGGQVQAGDKVLVHGGSGGVGQLVVQLCKQAGAEVWATASTPNQERLAELGAHPIDYRTQNFLEVAPKCDLIVDGAYFDTYLPSLDHLTEKGRIVSLPTLTDKTPAEQRGIPVFVPRARPLPEQLRTMAEDITAGRLLLEVSKVLPLEEVAEAHRQLESGHTRGKVVLDLDA
ncbi:NADP-dependent oxidoreductase [Naumannella sp. ID2617S]|nr:NADP-dependent oxidoreductase [Naumannella sp. ID2617S]